MPSTFELLCAGMIALAFGLVVLLNGYKLFLILLPIWGFFFGFVFGAQTMEAVFGVGFLATVTSWVVGFVVGAAFAVFSYLFWMAAVAIFSGMIGYAVGVGLMGAIGLDEAHRRNALIETLLQLWSRRFITMRPATPA